MCLDVVPNIQIRQDGFVEFMVFDKINRPLVSGFHKCNVFSRRNDIVVVQVVVQRVFTYKIHIHTIRF